MRGLTEPSKDPVRRVEVAEIVERLADDAAGGAERGRLLARLAAALLAGAGAAGSRAVLTGRVLVDAVVDLAPHVPVRDLPTLRRLHGAAGRRSPRRWSPRRPAPPRGWEPPAGCSARRRWPPRPRC